MKKATFLMLFLSSVFGFGQCPTSSLFALSSQAQINNFPILYPTCTTIPGSLEIWNGNDIVDLTPLSNITTITGTLWIVDTELTDLSGLENLTSANGIMIMSNQNLTDISALSNVTGNISNNLYIQSNASLLSLDGLQNLNSVTQTLRVTSNPLITNLNGLEGLTSVGHCYISHMNILNDISAVSNLTSINTIQFLTLPALTSLDGLQGINSGSSIKIHQTGINNLYGLNNLSTIGELSLIGNYSLTNLNGLENLSNVTELLRLSSNINLTNITALDHNISIADLTIDHNSSLPQCAVESVCDFLSVNTATINSNATGCNSELEVETVCAVPQTKLNTTWCNGSLTTFSQSFYANAVTGATHYEFQFEDVTNPGIFTSNVTTSTANNLSLANLIVVGKTYNVRVRAQVGGVWGMYGQVCELDAPASIPTTMLNTTWCNGSLTTFSQNFYANSVAGATQYEFEMKDQFSNVTNHIRNVNYTTLQVANLMTLGNTYEVRVKVYLNGAWGDWGTMCELAAPVTIPLTQLTTGWCGASATTFTQNINANSVAGATQYEFEFTDIATSIATSHFRNVNYTTLTVAGLTTIGKSYNVVVRAYFGSVAGTYGPVCTLTGPTSMILFNDESESATGSTITEETLSMDDVLNNAINIYPNPASDFITLSTNLADYSYTMYAINGQVVATADHVSGLTTIDLNDLENGVYSIVISNSDATFMETKRIVVSK